MKRASFAAAAALGVAVLTGCGSRAQQVNPAAAAPPTARVVEEPDLNIVKVDRPERFTLVTAGSREERPKLDATGVINPDVEKSIPVVSLASGRAIAVYVKLGDDVKKGQLLLKVLSNDIANAFQTYEQAKADEALAAKQLERAKLLYEHGAISLNDLQVAQDIEEKARVAERVAEQEILTMGGDPAKEDPVINVYAPSDGTIVEQNVVQSASVHTPDNQPNLFTIANLAVVWVICDVYENDLPQIRMGDQADIKMNAYPNVVLHGRITNIGKVLDPTIRTAKVRLQIANPGMMRAGMFVTATFYGMHGRQYANVPAVAVLHLHDRDWVFVPDGQGQFRRTEVMAGTVAGGMQDIVSGISPGQQVVNNALALSAESEQ